MTTGRWVVLALSLLLAAGCTIQPAGKRTQSAWVQREVSPAFSTVATADQLGDDWQDTGWSQPVSDVYSTLAGDRALLLRGGAPIWFDSGQACLLASDASLRGVSTADLNSRQAYDIVGRLDSFLHAKDLPDGEWHEIRAGMEDVYYDKNLILGISSHAARKGIWLAHVPQHGRGVAAVGRVSAAGVYEPVTELPKDWGFDLVALAGEDALAVTGGVVLYVDAASSEVEPVYTLPPHRTYVLAADSIDPSVGWLMVKAQRSRAGTAREITRGEPGYIVAFNTHGAELARISTGDVRFTRIYGDWANRRALLLHPSIGVALANAQTGELTWLLRQSGAAQLQLLPGGQVWAFVPDGIIGIEGDDLIRLAPKLAAGEVLTREQLAQVKPAAEALRWQWDDVQLSPLVHEAGQLTFFNAGEVDADWAEFDWDLSAHLVSRLLIARRPAAADLKLQGLSDAQLDEQVLAMLTALGWPEAAREAERGAHGDDELNAFYRLSPEGAADGDAGEFQLWITSGATMLKLTAAEDGPAAQEIPPDGTGGEPAR